MAVDERYLKRSLEPFLPVSVFQPPFSSSSKNPPSSSPTIFAWIVFQVIVEENREKKRSLDKVNSISLTDECRIRSHLFLYGGGEGGGCEYFLLRTRLSVHTLGGVND